MLCGCDYLEPIKGVGPKTALKLVREYDDFDELFAHLRKGKNPPPEDWPYKEARELFKHPNVTPAKDIEVSAQMVACICRSRQVLTLGCPASSARMEGARCRWLDRVPRQRQRLQVSRMHRRRGAAG